MYQLKKEVNIDHEIELYADDVIGILAKMQEKIESLKYDLTITSRLNIENIDKFHSAFASNLTLMNKRFLRKIHNRHNLLTSRIYNIPNIFQILEQVEFEKRSLSCEGTHRNSQVTQINE